MLVLQRGLFQKVMIGEDITITVTEIDWGRRKVKLSFEAPKDVIIDREEVHITRQSGCVLPKYLQEDDIKCLQRHNTKQ